jgi:cyclopropane fatty-acyl-phospholipid synthase-like methyltransferase
LSLLKNILKKTTHKSNHVEEVGAFYNQYHDAFTRVYGNVIQAFRTNNLENLLNYQFESAGFSKGDKLIDAGCGVCGPAIHFAKNFDVNIDAVSISEKQIEQAKNSVNSASLINKVNPILGDYHQLKNLVIPESYDGVYFLESFGHSTEKEKLLNQVWQVLKPGGICYIKDLFLKEAVLPEHQEKIDYEVGRINEAYKYQVSDMYEILKIIRKMGFIVNFVKTIDLDINDFENLAISNEFQELTGIAKIDNWETYIFPVDFFEIKITKPIHDLSDGLNKYFLQNLYYLQVKGLSDNEL